jgi:hypothetical protein
MNFGRYIGGVYRPFSDKGESIRGMNLNEILNNLNLGNVSIICFLLLSFIEISPIKINPWAALAKWLRHEL